MGFGGARLSAPGAALAMPGVGLSPPRSSAAPQQAHIREAQHLANPTFVAGALRDSRQVAIR